MPIRRTIVPALMLVTLAASLLPVAGLAAQEVTARAPAPTLRPPASATTALHPDGFIQRWSILEPIPRTGPITDSAVRATVATQYFPGQRTVVPRDGDRVTVGDSVYTWHAVDTSLHRVDLYHFAYALNRPTSNVLFWAVTVVDAPREIRDVRLAICSNAASVWWLNGEEVIAVYNVRQAKIDDGVSKRVTLRKGPNVIRAAVINTIGATGFCARFLDEQGEPVRDLTVRLDAPSR